MRRFLALIRKEWRDARALTVGATVAAVALSIALNEAWPGSRSAPLSMAYVVPALVALYLVAIASDLVASDVATRRVETYALLPTRPLLLWSAKLAFLLIAGLGFLVWVAMVQFGLHALAAGPTSGREVVRHGALALPHLGIALGLACAVFFYSAVLERGISAVIAGLLTIGAGVFTLVSANGAAPDLAVRPWHLGLAGLVAALAFATGSAFVFTSGEIHRVARLRRGILGIASVSILLLVPAAICSMLPG